MSCSDPTPEECAFLAAWKICSAWDGKITKPVLRKVIAAYVKEFEMAGEQWCAFEGGEQYTSWYPVGYGDRAGWEALAKRNPEKYAVKVRTVYALPTQEITP